MITDLKHYPAMKPSGVERLGDVPEALGCTEGKAGIQSSQRTGERG